MKKRTDKTQKELRAAREEAPMKASDLYAEITPLMKDYFMGEFLYDERAIIAIFPNGQKFKITTEEL